MQLESLGRGSGRKRRFTEMGRLGKTNSGIKASCPRVSTANCRLENYFHGGQPIKYIYKVIVSILCIVGDYALLACGLGLLASRHNFHSAVVELAFSFAL